jgi:hypothetical protein
LPTIWCEAAANPVHAVYLAQPRWQVLLPLRVRSRASLLLRPSARIKSLDRATARFCRRRRSCRGGAPPCLRSVAKRQQILCTRCVRQTVLSGFAAAAVGRDPGPIASKLAPTAFGQNQKRGPRRSSASPSASAFAFASAEGEKVGLSTIGPRSQASLLPRPSDRSRKRRPQDC